MLAKPLVARGDTRDYAYVVGSLVSVLLVFLVPAIPAGIGSLLGIGGQLVGLAIVSGLIAILLRIYSERTPEEILATKPDFVTAIGLDEHLSPTRNNGLHAMLTRIFAEAKAAAATA